MCLYLLLLVDTFAHGVYCVGPSLHFCVSAHLCLMRAHAITYVCEHIHRRD